MHFEIHSQPFPPQHPSHPQSKSEHTYYRKRAGRASSDCALTSLKHSWLSCSDTCSYFSVSPLHRSQNQCFLTSHSLQLKSPLLKQATVSFTFKRYCISHKCEHKGLKCKFRFFINKNIPGIVSNCGYDLNPRLYLYRTRQVNLWNLWNSYKLTNKRDLQDLQDVFLSFFS